MARIVLAVTAAGCSLAACGTSESAGSGQPPNAVESNARAGQIPVPAGRAPTMGPQAPNRSTGGGTRLSVINALRNGSPIFDADFADPAALKTADAVYLF